VGYLNSLMVRLQLVLVYSLMDWSTWLHFTKNIFIIKNIMGVYDSGREAIEFFKAKYVQMAGRFGINVAGSSAPTPPTLTFSDYIPCAPASGSCCGIPNWVYIGLFQFNQTTYYPSAYVFPATPSTCGSTVLTTANTPR